MENARIIKRRISSMESTGRSVTSMKLVASVKLRRVQSAQKALLPFVNRSEELLAGILSEDISLPICKKHMSSDTALFVLILGNRGLCGSYNNELLVYFKDMVASFKAAGKKFATMVIGAKGAEIAADNNYRCIRYVTDFPDVPDENICCNLSAYLTDLFLRGECSEVKIVSQECKSVMQQVPHTYDFLPLHFEKHDKISEDFIFIPDKESLLNELTEAYVINRFYALCLEAKVGEHSARMVAMNAASDSADSMISTLRHDLNTARQAAITTELNEIVSAIQSGNGL